MIIDRETIKSEVISNSTIQGSERVFGLRRKEEIYLTPNRFLNIIAFYCHEVGHILGDELSFKEEIKNGHLKSVLSIDEVKNIYTLIELTDEEIQVAQKYLMNESLVVSEDEIGIVISIANKLLEKFTHGAFDSNQVRLQMVSNERMDELIYETKIPTLEENEKGDLVSVNSKQGRNIELPAVLTQVCCTKILENTLVFYGLMKASADIRVSRTSSPAHARAKNLVRRAFNGSNYRLPSMLDNIRNNST